MAPDDITANVETSSDLFMTCVRECASTEGGGGGTYPIDLIYRNPKRKASRNILAMIRNAGIEPTIVEYLQQPPAFSDEQLLDAMRNHPILINRSFVVTELGTHLRRPSDLVLESLPQPQRGYFAQEGGDVTIDENSRSVS